MISGAPMRKILRSLLMVIGIAVVLYLMWSARASVLQLGSTIRPGWAAVALLLGIGLNVLQAGVFSILLQKHGAPGSSLMHVEAYLLSLLGKYLPGKLWVAVSQAATLPGAGSLRAILYANLEMAGVNALILAGLGIACLPALHFAERCLAIVMTVSIAAVALRQRFFSEIADGIAQRFPKMRNTALKVPTPLPRWLPVVLTSASLLALCAAASTAVVLASGQASIQAAPSVLAVLCLGWMAGLIALPVPAGIGVREASTLALWSLLAINLSRGALIAVMVVARVWQLAVDLLTFGAALMMKPVANVFAKRMDPG